MLCPKDRRPCIDDLCRGGGCIELGGAELLEQCQICGGTIDPESPLDSTCSCEYESPDYEAARDE